MDVSNTNVSSNNDDSKSNGSVRTGSFDSTSDSLDNKDAVTCCMTKERAAAKKRQKDGDGRRHGDSNLGPLNACKEEYSVREGNGWGAVHEQRHPL